MLKFDLISIPVKAYSAKRKSEEISLDWLHAECNSPIHYKRVCPVHGEVSNDEIVSAYRYGRDKYVVIEPDQLQKLRKHSDKTISVDAFVPPEAIDRIYDTDKIYYLLPDGGAAKKPFAVVTEAMAELKRCGIAQVILFRRERVVMLRVVDGALLMTVLNYQHLVKEPSEMAAAGKSKGTTRERNMATALIAASTRKRIDFASYTDSYHQELMDYVDAKVKGQEIKTLREDEEEPATLNFAEALKKSLKMAQKNRIEKTAKPRRTGSTRNKKVS